MSEKKEEQKNLQEEATLSLKLEEINATIAKLQEENDRKEALLDREEKLKALNVLGGKSTIQEPIKKEETAREYKDRIMRGVI